MVSKTASKDGYSADYPNHQDVPWPPDRPEHADADRLPSGAALIAVVLVSLGMWAMIWVAIALLASPP